MPMSQDAHLIVSALTTASLVLMVAGCGDSNGSVAANDAGSGEVVGASIGPELTISQSAVSVAETESHLAISPGGETVGAVWMGTTELSGFIPWFESSHHIGFAFSTDGGETWGNVSALTSPEHTLAFDPVVTADGAGNFYVVWMGREPERSILVSMAPSGSTTFGAPNEVNDSAGSGDYDKPWILETPGSALLVTYQDGGTTLIAARSTDGITWNRTVIVDGADLVANAAFPCSSAASDRIWVVYYIDGRIELRWSDDDGASWPPGNLTVVSLSDEPVAFDPPACVAHQNEVWIGYGLSNDPPLPETNRFPKLHAIQIVHSNDGGATVALRYDALDTGATSYGMHLGMTADEGGGIHVLYFAGSSDNDPDGSLRLVGLPAGADRFSASLAVDEPIIFDGQWGGQRFLGDYFGVAYSSDGLLTTYTDNTGDATHISFRRITFQ